jgi:hypothetical protein
MDSCITAQAGDDAAPGPTAHHPEPLGLRIRIVCLLRMVGLYQKALEKASK